MVRSTSVPHCSTRHSNECLLVSPHRSVGIDKMEVGPRFQRIQSQGLSILTGSLLVSALCGVNKATAIVGCRTVWIEFQGAVEIR